MEQIQSAVDEIDYEESTTKDGAEVDESNSLSDSNDQKPTAKILGHPSQDGRLDGTMIPVDVIAQERAVRKRQLNAIQSRRKRERQKSVVEKLRGQCSKLSTVNFDLYHKNQTLEGLLEKAKSITEMLPPQGNSTKPPPPPPQDKSFPSNSSTSVPGSVNLASTSGVNFQSSSLPAPIVTKAVANQQLNSQALTTNPNFQSLLLQMFTTFLAQQSSEDKTQVEITTSYPRQSTPPERQGQIPKPTESAPYHHHHTNELSLDSNVILQQLALGQNRLNDSMQQQRIEQQPTSVSNVTLQQQLPKAQQQFPSQETVPSPTAATSTNFLNLSASVASILQGPLDQEALSENVASAILLKQMGIDPTPMLMNKIANHIAAIVTMSQQDSSTITTGGGPSPNTNTSTVINPIIKTPIASPHATQFATVAAPSPQPSFDAVPVLFMVQNLLQQLSQSTPPSNVSAKKDSTNSRQT